MFKIHLVELYHQNFIYGTIFYFIYGKRNYLSVDAYTVLYFGTIETWRSYFALKMRIYYWKYNLLLYFEFIVMHNGLLYCSRYKNQF